MNNMVNRPLDPRSMASDPTIPLGSGIRLLLVSSDAADRVRIRKELESRFAIAEAANAEEALFWLDERYFAIILTDYELSDRDGAWLLEQVATKRPEMSRFLMSAKTVADVWRLRAEKVFHVIMLKPIVPQHFSDYIVCPNEPMNS